MLNNTKGKIIMTSFEDIIKGALIDMFANYETCHLCYSWDIANIVASELVSRKPWWWLINVCYGYYPEIKDTLRRYHIPLKGDTTDLARQAIIIKVAEMVGASDTVIDHWHTYDTKKGELPSMLDRTVARHIAMDLIFE